jgi:hypothetical protein
VQAASPFTIVGFLQRATLVAGDAASGGTLVVNGHTIKVTTNTLVNMPGAYLKWQDLFSQAPRPWGPTQTGMALLDHPKPPTTYEVMVQGNRIVSANGDDYLAGLIFIWQQSVNSGQGFINYIDYQHSELRVGGTLNDPNTGTRVRLNDPLGRYGKINSPDTRFAIDESNPTVRTATGYPMCIPRANLNAATANNPVTDDPQCPQINRPKDTANGGFLRQFFMQPAPCSSFPLLPTGAPSVTPPGCTQIPAPDAPDATKQMPFEVGDYVTFQGSLEHDKSLTACAPTQSAGSPACQYVSSWSVIANIGAFTAPGTMPAYVAIDVTQMGTGGINNPGLPQEATASARIEGFTTDPTEPIDIFGVDIDPCTGATVDRYWGTQPALQIAQLGKFRFIPNGGTFTPAVREVRAVSQTLSHGAMPADIASAKTYANGIVAGQYDSPMSKFIFPESAEVGLTPVPLNFQDFPFLAAGFLPSRCTASLSPLTLSFSGLTPGATSAAQSVTLTNTGSGGLDVGKITISDSFAQTNNCGTQLQPGASCTLNVSFTAGETRVQTGVLQLSDTANGSPQTVSLIGTVTLSAAPNFVPSVLTFGDQAPGTSSRAQVVTLSNTGTTDLNIGSIGVSNGYWQSNKCGTTLKAGSTCVIAVKFTPGNAGKAAGSLTLVSDAPGSPHTLALNGASSDFSISVPQPSATLTNAQSAAVYTVNVTGTAFSSGAVDLSCSNLPPLTHCKFSPATVTLNGAGTQAVSLSIYTAKAATASLHFVNPWQSLTLAVTLLGGVVTLGSSRRRNWNKNVGLAVIAACAIGLGGCGGMRVSSSQTQTLTIPSLQQVRITGSAANGAVHSVDLSLNIKPGAISIP